MTSFPARILAGWRASVRWKLLLMVLLPLGVVLPILAALVFYWGSTTLQKVLIFKINSDLAVAHAYFDRLIVEAGGDVRGLAGSARLVGALADRSPQNLGRLLAGAMREEKLDFLNLLDAEGNLVASGNELAVPSNYRSFPLVARAAGGEAGTAIDVFSAAQLADIDVRLRDRAMVSVLPTRNAAPSDRKSEDRGMVIHAAAPVYDRKGRLAGVLQGGVLLNRNLAFVDTINDLIYREGTLPEGSHGTATLFLGDVRIATNVRLFEGERALGTRVSQEVRDKVLGRGETWLDRAFVVNDWYVSAYEPVTDSFGRRVGMLYVGFLEAPFAATGRNLLAAVVAVFAAIGLLGALFSLRWARTIFQPLERMNQTMSAVEAGEGTARVGRLASTDEIGELARHLDRLLDAVDQRSAELKRLAGELDAKVVERTAELESANRNLRDAQRQLVMSEKLAAIGQLTAGVAHEINNPAAVLQGNLDVARELLGPDAARVATELRLMETQVNRIREIVTRLLQFARPTEFAGYVETVDTARLFEDSLVLVRHLLARGDIAVERRFEATRPVGINRNELQQVMINLMVNAIHAMADGGKLTLETRDWKDDGVALAVRDNGHGIRREDLMRVFDPFYTTKRQHGTGLGLSISYALVERYGGTISLESEPGRGAEFTVWLKCAPGEPRDAEARAMAGVV